MDLRELLKENGIKKIKLANELNISRQTLNYKMNSWKNKRKGFTIDELSTVAKLLGKSLDFFK